MIYLARIAESLTCNLTHAVQLLNWGNLSFSLSFTQCVTSSTIMSLWYILYLSFFPCSDLPYPCVLPLPQSHTSIPWSNIPSPVIAFHCHYTHQGHSIINWNQLLTIYKALYLIQTECEMCLFHLNSCLLFSQSKHCFSLSDVFSSLTSVLEWTSVPF